MSRHLRIGEFVRPPDACHFHRARVRPGLPPDPHTHDFTEVFWIEEGDGWEMLDRVPRAVRTGSLALVHPRDEHSFGADAGHALNLANLAFPVSAWEELRRRCFVGEDDLFAADAPRRFELSADDLAELMAFGDELDAGARTRAALERFLLNLAHLLAHRRRATPAPAWLSDAVSRLREPEQLQRGTHALVALCARSPEHVAREARRCYGKTPTDLVNDARIAWAARRLIASEQPIIDICLECGLSNLGHFYRLFRDRHHASPQRWRERQRRIVQG
jgi:AraC family cel operon transcriptional repressor